MTGILCLAAASPNKENFLSVIKTLFQAFQGAIKGEKGICKPLQSLSGRGKTEKHVARLL